MSGRDPPAYWTAIRHRASSPDAQTLAARESIATLGSMSPPVTQDGARRRSNPVRFLYPGSTWSFA